MEANQSRSALELVPEPWFEVVVGLWMVVVASFGTQITVHYSQQVLRPLGMEPWAAITVTVVITAVAYGVFGFSLASLYRKYRNFEPRLFRQPLDSAARRWLAGLVGLGILLMILGGIGSEQSVVAVTLIGFGFPAYPEGVGGITLGLAGVNDMVNQAPLVIFAAALAGLLIGPAMGAVFHGVLQDTVTSVAPPIIAIGVTAIVTTAAVSHGTVASPTTGVVFGFVLGVAYAYRKTENLVMVMASYGFFNGVAPLLAWLDILASLYAVGHLFG